MLLTFIRVPFVIKIVFCVFFVWLLKKGFAATETLILAASSCKYMRISLFAYTWVRPCPCRHRRAIQLRTLCLQRRKIVVHEYVVSTELALFCFPCTHQCRFFLNSFIIYCVSKTVWVHIYCVIKITTPTPYLIRIYVNIRSTLDCRQF